MTIELMICLAPLRGGPKQTIKQTKSGLGEKDLAKPKNNQTSKYNAKLIKYSSTTKSALWGAEGATEKEFGRLGLVFHKFGIVFAYFVLLSGLANVFLIKSRFGLFDLF